MPRKQHITPPAMRRELVTRQNRLSGVHTAKLKEPDSLSTLTLAPSLKAEGIKGMTQVSDPRKSAVRSKASSSARKL